MTQSERLARLKNYSTRYEIILTNGTLKFLVAYTSQRSKRGILSLISPAWCSSNRSADAARELQAAIFHLTNSEIPLVAKVGDVFHGNEWRVLFSGRTQREAIIQGKFPFILRAIAA